MSDFLPTVELLSFSPATDEDNPRVQYVLDEITRLLPDRVVIVGGWDRNLAEQMRCSAFAGQYAIHVNDQCRLDWLQQTAAAIRTGGKAILMSNFPREGNETLNVCPTGDSSLSLAVYFWGPYSPGYYNNVARGQARGGRLAACRLLVDTARDNDFLDVERQELSACKDKSECQAMLQKILASLEGDQNCPAANWGGVLI